MLESEASGEPFAPPSLAEGVTSERLGEWLDGMLLIRYFESESVRLSLAGKIPGGIHSSEGQEAVAVGTVAALQAQDVVSGTHRSHHHALAKGLCPRSVMAELFGKATGLSEGRGGSMHLVDAGRRFLGSNGIVGAGLGLAMGAALAMKLQSQDLVAVGFFGDGGANTGRVWESINLAALWGLPLIAVCENNLYAVETHIADSMAGTSIAGRASWLRSPGGDGRRTGHCRGLQRGPPCAPARRGRRRPDIPGDENLPVRRAQRRRCAELPPACRGGGLAHAQGPHHQAEAASGANWRPELRRLR